MAVYLILAGILYAVSVWVPIRNTILHLLLNTVLILVFVGYILKKDLPLKSIPILNRLVK